MKNHEKLLVTQSVPRDDVDAAASELIAACDRLIGKPLARLSFPGGRGRKTAIAHTEDGHIYAVTRRRRKNRAELEFAVLEALYGEGAPVPQAIAFHGGWLVQEFLGPRRLSEQLDAASGGELRNWLDKAALSLERIHTAGHQAGLARKVAIIGAKPGWLDTLIVMPGQVGAYLDTPPPSFEASPVKATLAIRAPRFIKWDARPGNAVVQDSGDIGWIDWEHCGCRDPLDDLAWLLGDEWTPDDPDSEAWLLERHLPAFAGSRDLAEARNYLMTFGCLHMCVRLSLILSNKGDGGWWDRATALRNDRVGVTPQQAQRLCARAARWAAASVELRPLAPWFAALGPRMATL